MQTWYPTLMRQKRMLARGVARITTPDAGQGQASRVMRVAPSRPDPQQLSCPWDGGHPEDRCDRPTNGRHGRPLVCTPLVLRYDYVTVITSNVTVTITLRSGGRDYCNGNNSGVAARARRAREAAAAQRVGRRVLRHARRRPRRAAVGCIESV